MSDETKIVSDVEQPNRKLTGVAWYDILIFILLFLVSSLVVGLVGLQMLSDSTNSVMISNQDKAIIYFSLFLLTVVLIVAYMSLRRIKVGVKFFSKGWALPVRYLCGYLLLWMFNFAIEPIQVFLPASNTITTTGVWVLLTAVVCAPLFEELFFRGYLAGAIRARYGVVAAWIASSVVFALVHGNPSAMLSAFTGGLVLGYFYLKYGSLIQTIMLHVMNNLTAYFLLSINRHDMSWKEIISNDALYWPICVVNALLSVALIWYMFRQLRGPKQTNIPSECNIIA